MAERLTGHARRLRRPRLVLAAAVTAACALATAACSSGGDKAAPQPTSTAPSVAPAAYGAYGTTTKDAYPETHTLSPSEARLVGPHFVVQFDKVSFTTRLSHAQAMNFGYFGDMDMGDMDHGDMSGMDHADHGKKAEGPPVLAAPGHRFMIVHTVPALPKLAPALPEYRNNIAPEDKVKGAVRAGGKTVPLPGIVRDLASDHSILVSVPTGSDPVLAITDAGRTQLLNLRTGHRESPQTTAYYPVRAADDRVGVSVHGTVKGAGGSASLAVHSAAPSLQPYAEGRGWAGKGKAWLYLGGDVQTQLADGSGGARLDAALDPARSFTLTLPDGRTVHGAGTASTKAKLPLGTTGAGAGGGGSTAGAAQGALSVAFEVPADFRSGSVRFTPEGTYTYGVQKAAGVKPSKSAESESKSKSSAKAPVRTAFTVRDKAGTVRVALH